jgi:hypothetical protein
MVIWRNLFVTVSYAPSLKSPYTRAGWINGSSINQVLRAIRNVNQLIARGAMRSDYSTRRVIS